MSLKFLPLCLSFMVLIFFGSRETSHAQNAEIGANVGMINYIGELAPDFPLATVLKETRPIINGYLRVRVKSKWHQRVDLTFGRIFADDANHKNHLGGTTMNTFIVDAAWAVEYNFIPYREKTANQHPIPFGFMGFNVFAFKPDLFLQRTRTDITVNEKLQANGGINLGVGLKGKMWKQYSYNLVIRHTITLTDNLEGFKTDTSSSTDFFTYIMAGISKNIKLK